MVNSLLWFSLAGLMALSLFLFDFHVCNNYQTRSLAVHPHNVFEHALL